MDRVLRTDTLVLGSGVAGLSTALAAEGATVLTKSEFGDGGSTRWAQGGVAAAVGNDDTPELHAADTITVAGGLASREAVEILTQKGPHAIDRLIALGARFDHDDSGGLSLGREAGHSRRRILHANGDATGAEIQRALSAAVRERPDIQILDNTLAVDLILSDGAVVGVLALTDGGDHVAIFANAVVLATGGVGRAYARTTNPPGVTGDGIAMAYRAGAALADTEFVQFHPTAMASGADPMPLLTEALRGEGATLIDESGNRFMTEVHADAELAPRDVVARSIWQVMQSGSAVFLDARIVGEEFPERFPTVFNYAQEQGIDPRSDLLPVSPAAHYYMGGVLTDRHGRTSLPGLWAAGEVTSTGVHGANRLASNSLLEGLVFGSVVAADSDEADSSDVGKLAIPRGALSVGASSPNEHIRTLRDAMWNHVGVVRDAAGLERFLALHGDLAARLSTSVEGRNLATVTGLIARAALARKESRGGHYRSDYPDTDATLRHRSVVRREPELEHLAVHVAAA